jgi:stage V sporulation protein G
MSTKTTGPTQTAIKAMPVPKLSIRIQKLFDENSKVKAVASVNIDDAFAVHGIKVMDSDKGLFVSMPRSSYKSQGETKYQDVFHPITAESRQQLINAVLQAYEQKLVEQPSEDELQSEDEEPGMAQSM